jgi:signal transduction histidine kinase/CheY-like chemotaxis protein
MLHPLRVLLLDDDADRAAVFSLVLRDRGCDVQHVFSALEAADVLRSPGLQAVVLGGIQGAARGDLLARVRQFNPGASITLLVPVLDEGAAREALAMKVDDVILADGGAAVRVAERLMDSVVPDVAQDELRTFPGRRAPSRVDDAPTQQMAAHRPRAADQLVRPGPALDRLLDAAGIAAFQARIDGSVLSGSERLGDDPSLGIDPDDWRALQQEATQTGTATRTVRLVGPEERLAAVTLRLTADGTLDGLLLDRSETEALWGRLEQLRLAEGDRGGDVIALDSRRMQREANTDPGTEAPSPPWRQELAQASHDLQEPVRSARVYAELLEEQLGPSLHGEARELVTRGKEAAQRAEAMLSEVMARVAGKEAPVEEEECDAEEVLAAVLVNLSGAVHESGASVTHGPLPRLALPPTEFAQILQNLVGNALKYRGTKAPRVHVSSDRDGDAWRITVADNGRGIDPSFLPRVFDMFQRGPGAEDRPGSGIGLAVCKQAAEARSGTIAVESTPGVGSTFTLRLPGVVDSAMAKNANA